MIGFLPQSLNVNGKEIPIKTDFRVALVIFQAFNDVDLKEQDKVFILLDAIYGIDNLEKEDYQEAVNQAKWFLDCGENFDEEKKRAKKLVDWEQDEKMIFSAVNKVAGMETRAVNIHWWTWYGFFTEIGEGLFSNVLKIRQKKSKGKKLEKYEQDFYQENKKMIDFKVRLTAEEQAEVDYWNELLKD